jgi:DNA repair ATPase RecN
MLNKYVEATRGFLSKSEPQGGFMNLRPGSGGVMNIPKMTPEEAADSDAQERAKRAMLLNHENDEGEPINLTEEQKEQLKKERAELKKIEEMESLIAKAVETSDEEEEEPEPEVYEVVESEEEEVDEVVEQKEINPIFSKEIRTKKKLETEKQIFNDYYSDDSDDLETIAI